MTWYQALLLTIVILVALAFVFFGPILLVDLFDTLLEGRRRKKHPEYFKYWDESLKLSFERGAEYNRRKEYFDYKFKLYSLSLRDGECTYEYYSESMNKLMVEYQELCAWFQEEETKINELLIKADLYAKEHDLLWGIIYGSKST
jgi:hypothetical protein